MPPKEKPNLKTFLPAPAKKTLPNKSQAQPSLEEDKTLLHLLRFVIVTAIVVVFGLIFVAWGTYAEGWQNYFVESVDKVVPFPAASVGYDNWITVDEYNQNVKAMRQFLESREAAYAGGDFDFSTPDGLKRLAIIKKNILNQLISNKLTEVVAKKEGINVSNEELKDVTQKIINRDGKRSENLAQLNSLYGWSEEEFRERVIKNLLYQEKLEDKVKASGELDREAKAKIESIAQKIKSGKDFSSLAQEFSDSPSRQYGGKLPAFSRDDTPQMFADIAFKLNVGDVSDPIEADDGWHIIKIEKKYSEAGKDKVEISHIFIGRKTLKEWLLEKKDGYKILVFLKPYYWQSQAAKLFFRDENLNQFEHDWDRRYLNEKTQETDFLLNTMGSSKSAVTSEQ